MRRSASARARITENHFMLLPIREAGHGGIHLRASTTPDGRSSMADDLPEFLLDQRCRLAVRGQGQARLHRLGRSCPLSAEHALVVLDGDVLERGDRRWHIRFEATWRIWQEKDATETRGNWPAALALAACLGFAPMANGQTAAGRAHQAATTQSPGPLGSPARPTTPSPVAPSAAEASDEHPQDFSSPQLGRLVVEVSSAQPVGALFRARVVSADGTVERQHSSTSSNVVFNALPVGEYRLTIAQDGGPDRPEVGMDLEIAPGTTTHAEVTLGAPPLAINEVTEGDIVVPILVTPILPGEMRRFGDRSLSYDDRTANEDGDDYDDDDDRGDHEQRGPSGRRWPSSLPKRPLSPWEGLAEGHVAGDIDLGAGHAGSTIRVAPSVAYGIDRHWGLAVDTRRGLCLNGEDGRCEHRFDQISADLIYLLDSRRTFEWLVRAGLATGPFDPFALSVRVGGAAKVLVVDRLAIQVEVLAQVPANQRDHVPTLIQIPAQLQVQMVPHVAATLSTGLRGAFLSGERDLTVPAAGGLLFGWHAFDLGVEWRFPRVLGTGRTWDEGNLLALVAARLD